MSKKRRQGKRATRRPSETVEERAQRRLAERYAASLGASEVETFTLPPGEQVSDLLDQLIEPWRELCTDLRSTRALFGVAVVAWNLAVAPDGAEGLVEGLLAGANAEDAKQLRALMTALRARKQRLFPDCRRVILKHEVTRQGEGYYVAVISQEVSCGTPPPNQT